MDGWMDVIRFKVLKKIKLHSIFWPEYFIPWKIVGRFVDSRLSKSSFPIGIATNIVGDPDE